MDNRENIVDIELGENSPLFDWKNIHKDFANQEVIEKWIDVAHQCRKLKTIMIEFCTNMTGVNFHIFQVGVLYSI